MKVTYIDMDIYSYIHMYTHGHTDIILKAGLFCWLGLTSLHLWFKLNLHAGTQAQFLS